MAIKQGDSVTNSKCSHWGAGVVLSIGASSAEVRFATVGPKRLLVDVLVPSAEPAAIVSQRGKKADPRFQARLKELLASFASITDREGIENIEEMIYEAFFVSGARKGVVKRRLSRWMGTNPYGHQNRGYAEVKALYDFLYPETSRAEKAPQ